MPSYLPKRNENQCPHSALYGIFRTVLFKIAKNLKLFKYPSTGEWINKMLHIYTTDPLLSEKNEWTSVMCSKMDGLQNRLRERSQTQKTLHYRIPFIWNFCKR